jgi:hypothetical protein
MNVYHRLEGCFGLETAEGQFAGIEDEFVILATERTMPPLNDYLGNRQKIPRPPKQVQFDRLKTIESEEIKLDLLWR